MSLSPWRTLCPVLFITACSDDASPEYEGTPGAPVTARFELLVPIVSARVDDGAEVPFLVDTGAPFTILDDSAFPGREAGAEKTELAVFGLSFPSHEVVVMDVFGGEPGGAHDMYGLIGGDLVNDFALSLDYHGGRGWLSDPYDPGSFPADLDTEIAVAIPMEVRGGGNALVAPGEVVEVEATRILVEARFEGKEPRWVVVDTGASAVVVREDYLAELAAPNRPTLQGVRVVTVSGLVSTYMTRVFRLELPASAGAATIDDLPVLALGKEGLFQGIAQEVGKDIVALIGGTYLRWYMTSIDYPAKQLHLARYKDRSHIPEDEFIGPGFTLERRDDDWTIVDCYPGTDAYEAEMLRPGDVVEEIAMMSIAGQDTEVISSLLSSYELGDEVPVGIRRETMIELHLVLVEDLLPSYPAP